MPRIGKDIEAAENSRKLQKHEAASVKGMLATPGWQILEKKLETHRQDLLTDLLKATDDNEMRSYQAQLKAIDFLTKKIQFFADIET